MAITPNSMVLPQLIRTTSTIVTAANTTYSGTAIPSGVLLLSAQGINGSVLRSLKAVPNATVTATQLQLFKWNGTNLYLVDSQLMGAYTMATTTAVPVTDFGYSDSITRYIGNGSATGTTWSYYVGIGVALTAGITFTAEFGDF